MSIGFNSLSPRLLNDCYSFLEVRDLARAKGVSKDFKRSISEFRDTHPVQDLALFRNRPINRSDFLSVAEGEQKIAHNDATACLRVAILTSDGYDKHKGNDKSLIDSFAQYGVQAEHVVWERPPANWKRYQAVIVRSTWGYQDKLDKFLATFEWPKNEPTYIYEAEPEYLYEADDSTY
jgi:hypothetical protein